MGKKKKQLDQENRMLKALLATLKLAGIPEDYQELLVKARHEIARLEEQRAGNLVDLEHVKGYLRRLEERMAGKMPAPPVAAGDVRPAAESR